MYTSGVGALIDLPRMSVMVRGLDEWDYSNVGDDAPLSEERLLAAVQRDLGSQVSALKRPPWRQPVEGQGYDPADLVGGARACLSAVAALHALQRACTARRG